MKANKKTVKKNTKISKTSKKTAAKKTVKKTRAASHLEPKVLFETSELAVINKPAGLVVHTDGKTSEPNLCDWLLQKYPATETYEGIKNVGEPSRAPDGTVLLRPGIVHRLDRETSGAMVIAKTQPAFLYLKELFQNKLVHKTYNAFVWGIVGTGAAGSKGVIDRPIGRSKSDFRKWSAGRFARGEMREAITEYKVLDSRRFENFEEAGIVTEQADADSVPNITPAVSLIEARPLTGRTHQIRVHMHFSHHPVVGDSLYAPNHPKILGFNRLALHSRIIEFTEPSGSLVRIEAPLPTDFLRATAIFEDHSKDLN